MTRTTIETRPISECLPFQTSAPAKKLDSSENEWRLSSATPKIKVTGLNHFNITASAKLIERLRRFYVDIIGLTVGPRAHLDHEGYWLYAEEVPILHLSVQRSLTPVVTSNRGHFNHISLSCTGLSQAIIKLAVTSTPYYISHLSDIRQTQLFLTDPAGISVELTFFNECL